MEVSTVVMSQSGYSLLHFVVFCFLFIFPLTSDSMSGFLSVGQVVRSNRWIRERITLQTRKRESVRFLLFLALELGTIF